MMSAGGEAGLGAGCQRSNKISSEQRWRLELETGAGAGGGRSGVAGSRVTGATAGQRPPNKYPPTPGRASAEYRAGYWRQVQPARYLHTKS